MGDPLLRHLYQGQQLEGNDVVSTSDINVVGRYIRGYEDNGGLQLSGESLKKISSIILILK